MDVFNSLRRAVLDYDSAAAGKLADQIVEQGLDPLAGLDSISSAMQEVGQGYSSGDLWLPDLVGAADASQAALPVLEAEIRRRGQQTKSLGTVVIGTVSGDIHTIGKSMVGVLLAAQGFRVFDAGANVASQTFVQAVRDNQADILALSALLTTTAPEMGRVIQALKEAGIRENIRIMVGGGAITQDFADRIGADGYGATAPDGVDLARKLLNV